MKWVPWTASRSNQSILKEKSPRISLEGMMLKLKLQYFGHLMWRVDSLEKTLMLGGIGGRRRRGQQRMSWLDGITDSMDVSLSELRGVDDGQGGSLRFMGSQRVRHDWTELMWPDAMILVFRMLSFKQAFSLSCFNHIKKLLSYSPLSAITMVLPAYQRLLIFLPSLDSNLWFVQPAFLHDVLCIYFKYTWWHYTAFMYSFHNFEPVSCSMSGSNCCFLTHIQVSQVTDKVIWYSHLFKNFS